jgi:hypothetical protein
VRRALPLGIAPDWTNVALTLVLGFLASIASLRLTRAWTLGVTLRGGAACALGCQLAFNQV